MCLIGEIIFKWKDYILTPGVRTQERGCDDAFQHQVQYASYSINTGASSTLSNYVDGA
jgi:hypothetical protein